MSGGTLTQNIMILKIIIRKLFPFIFSFNPFIPSGEKKSLSLAIAFNTYRFNSERASLMLRTLGEQHLARTYCHYSVFVVYLWKVVLIV